MAVLSSSQELLSALAANPFSTNPLADLKKNGHSLSPALQQEMKTALGNRKLAGPPAGVTAASFKGKLTFQSAPLRVAPFDPPTGSYDAMVGVRLDSGNIALDALYQAGTIPHQVALDQLLSPTDLTALGGGFIVDQPGGTISRLHITSAPTLAETTDGNTIVALRIPVQIDWTSTSSIVAGRQINRLVTKAIGTMQLTMRLVPNVIIRPQVSNSSLTLSIQLVTDVQTAADSPRLTLDASSPVQLKSPAPPDKIDGLAVIIQNALAKQFSNSLSLTISPLITLPTGSLEIRHIDVLARGGALLAGLQVVGTQGTADPATLADLLPNQDTNIFVQVRDVVANLLIQSALRSGQLTAAAKKDHDNAVIESASARFDDNAFVAQVSGKLVNECLDSIDLGFIETRTVNIKLQGSSIEIDQHDDNSIAEWSNMWCLLASLALIGLAALGGALLGGVATGIIGGVLGFILTGVGPFLLDQVISGIFSDGGPNSTIVDLSQPIPGSDALPTLSNAFISISNGAALIAATAATRADDINTIIYARFLVADGISVFNTRPLTGVKVELMDQDKPAPPGDDASTGVPANTSSSHGGHSSSTVHTFVAPSSDEKLAEGTTDLDGTVRFALLKDQLGSTAGRIKTVTTRFDPDAEKNVSTTTFKPVPEARPDLYFRVTMPEGKVVDTRAMPGGFMVNFTSARLGTLAKPIMFNFGIAVGGVREIGAAG
jgi:hypothetical protein